LESPETPPRGLAWLIGRQASFELREHLRRARILDENRYKSLAMRALDSPVGDDIAPAAQLLTEVISWNQHAEIRETLVSHDVNLRAWFSSISPENAWALGDLANALHH